MSTNYYLTTLFDQIQGKGRFSNHIGKSSAGWCFALHIDPTRKDYPQTYSEWQACWRAPGATILDEYGNQITAAELEEVITQRSIFGYPPRRFNDAFSIPGEGSWDYVIGNFS
jgi:hypothetical protein